MHLGLYSTLENNNRDRIHFKKERKCEKLVSTVFDIIDPAFERYAINSFVLISERENREGRL